MRKLPILASVVAGLTSLALAAVSSNATFHGANGLILYQAAVGKHLQLFTIRPDGSRERQLTFLRDSDALNPAWSRDGRRITFARDYAAGSAEEHLDIFTMDADGSGLHGLGLAGLNGAPSWSPDGRRIVFVNSAGVAIVNADGSGLRQVVHGGDNSSPMFSPDGRRIAFVRSSGERKASIFVANADGSALERVTPAARGLAAKIDWSPDGSRIVYSSPEIGRPGKSSNVFTIRPNGTGIRQLTHDRGGRLNNGADSWSPDGKKIVYINNHAGVYALNIMSADGSGSVLVATPREPHLAAWGPNL